MVTAVILAAFLAELLSNFFSMTTSLIIAGVFLLFSVLLVGPTGGGNVDM